MPITKKPKLKIKQKQINEIAKNHPTSEILSPATSIKTISYLVNFPLFATLKQVLLTSKLTPARMQEKTLTEHHITVILSERPQP